MCHTGLEGGRLSMVQRNKSDINSGREMGKYRSICYTVIDCTFIGVLSRFKNIFHRFRRLLKLFPLEIVLV